MGGLVTEFSSAEVSPWRGAKEGSGSSSQEAVIGQDNQRPKQAERVRLGS